MSTSYSPKLPTNGLIFQYDKANTKKSWKGAPTTNMLTNNPTIELQGSGETELSTVSYNAVIPFVTPYRYGRYPTEDLDSDGGVSWDADIKDPLGNYGAILMRMYPGGNSQTQVQCYATDMIPLDKTKDHRVSVWCKSTTANVFRIQLNTTTDSASNWGLASGYHSGGGEWERLGVDIPADAEHTSINTIRCQGVGTTITAQAHFKYIQVEERDFDTPFVDGTRSDTEAILDLMGNEITVTDLTYTEGDFTFDGSDDKLSIDSGIPLSNQYVTVAAWVKVDGHGNWHNFINNNWTNSGWLLFSSASNWVFGVAQNSVQKLSYLTHNDSTEWTHLVGTYDGASVKLYVNGIAGTSIDSLTAELDTGYTIGVGAANRPSAYEMPQASIYNRALTSTEVLQLFNTTRGRYGI